MRYGLLGATAPPVGGPRVRTLFALLALNAGKFVSAERLIDGLYGEHPPDGAANALQSQVSRLRQTLEVEFTPAGYRLDVDPDDVDTHRFERLAVEGHRALESGEHQRAAELLREALALWRGEPFADIADAPFALPQATRLRVALSAHGAWAVSGTPQSRGMTKLSNARKWGTLAICCLAQLLIALDMTVLHLAIPALTESLKPSAAQLLWIADIYGFAIAGFLVTMGTFGDRIGRKKLLLIGAVVFGGASVATALAPSPEILIAARALLGIAGATLMPSTLSLIRNVFTDAKERTAAIGMWSGVAVLGIGFGPVIAGFLLGRFWWGSVFLVNVPVVVVLVIAGALVLPESRNPDPGRLDALSVVLSIAGMLGVVYAIKETATSGIGHADVIAAAVAGVAGLVVFARRQGKLTAPLIDIRLFAQRAFSSTISATVVSMFVQLALSLAMAQYFQLVVGWSAWKSGLARLPGMAGALVGGVLAGFIVTKIGRASTVALGCSLSAAGFVLLAQLTTEMNYPFLITTMVICGAGVAMTLTVATDTVLGVVPKERAGAASAISETANELGGALGIAVLGSVLAALYRGDLRLPVGVPAEAAGTIRDTLGSAMATAAQLPADVGNAVTTAARHAFVHGLDVTMYACAGLMAVLAVSVLFTMRGVPKVMDTHEVEADDVLVAA